MKKNIIMILIPLIMFNCEDIELERTFLIRKGEHYATTRLIESLESNSLEFYARFNETAIYDLGDNAIQTNKNKLMGFSDCNSLHHENSARFAWQWYHGKIEIYAYCYVNGTRVEQYIGDVQINTRNKYSIVRSAQHYEFSLNGEQIVRIARGDTCNKGIYYILWPYFGGSVPAPHDVTIFIERIYK